MNTKSNNQVAKNDLYPCCFSSNYGVLQYHPEEFFGKEKKHHNNALLAVYKTQHSPNHANTHRNSVLQFDHLHI